MVDWAKKLQKHIGSKLYPGEEIEAGIYVQPGGTLGRSAGTSAGGLLGTFVADKLTKANETASSEDGLGTNFPQARAVLGMSSQRLMAFDQGSISGKPKEMLTSVPLRDIVSISAEKHKVSYTVSIAFADGSTVSYEAVKMAKPDEFVAAFERLRG